MSFHTTIARLREASGSCVRGEAPDTCRVRREDIRIALDVIDRLDADLRQAGILAIEARDLSAPESGAGWGMWHGMTPPAPPPSRNHIVVKVPYLSPIGSESAIQLLYRGGAEGKAHLSLNVAGHPLRKSEAGASLTVDGMRCLVDGLMDCIQAIERNRRINSEESDG